MDIRTQRELVALTNEFYRSHADTFSATRRSAWRGWLRCARLIDDAVPDGSLSILDVGCGNLRFESFLRDALPARALAFHTVDDCPALPPDDLGSTGVSHHEADVIAPLLGGADPLKGLDLPSCDVTVCFGLMHHVPDSRCRAQLLGSLVEALAPDGLAIVSLWRFMDVPGLAAKAAEALARARDDEAVSPSLRSQLPALAGSGDYLLGWQNEPSAWRYCHSFSDADIDGLVASVACMATVEERFRADGRDGRANEYLALRRLP